MKKLLLPLFFLTFFTANAQLTATVKDSLTKQPVPYANIWVLGENTGTTADENGNFSFDNSAENKKIVLSCVGYERKEIAFNAALKTIYLKRVDNLLKEVLVTPRLRDKVLVIGKLNKKKDRSYHSNTGFPWISGRFIPYSKKYEKTSYIKTVKCYTSGGVNNSKFGVRIYDVDKDGMPNNLLHYSPVFAFAQKGKSFAEVNLSELNIKIPESGVVVCFEWLIVPENKYQFEYYDPSQPKIKLKQVQYSPSFISTDLKRGEVGWTYSKGSWRRSANKNDKVKGVPTSAPAIELTLSN